MNSLLVRAAYVSDKNKIKNPNLRLKIFGRAMEGTKSSNA
jgi:hypothetical protein